MQISTIHSFCLEYLKSKNQFVRLLDDDTGEKKSLFIQKFLKNLGFSNANTLYPYQIDSVINKYGEFTSFSADIEGLIKHIEENSPVSEDYLNYINSLGYFSKKRIEDNDFKNDWYNARYVQIARSYPIYLNLLDEFNYVDYDTLQLKTLKELEKDPHTPFNVVLIDEFQDTDPLQFEIFKNLEADCEYFTAVGDVDQHIYAFRSSFLDYFDEMKKITNPKIISLDVNYRSTESIVDFTDTFIKNQRKEYSQKHLKSANEEYDNDVFIIKNDNSEDEALSIFNAIQTLKGGGVDYDDIAVLYRRHINRTVAELVSLFDSRGIDFTILGQSDLSQKDEVKAVVLMLWYITRRVDRDYISSADELKDFNLKGFCDEYFENAFFSLDNHTREYLISLQDSYHEELLKCENEIRKSRKKGRVRAVHNIRKNEDLDTLTEIFAKVEKPVVNPDEIQNENDRRFFTRLDELREDTLGDEPPTILDVYYEIIGMCNCFRDINGNLSKAANLGKLTQTIYNYEEFISKTDIRGLYFFLTRIIKNYDSYTSNNGGVQLMTVHASKGLEFPVVFVATLEIPDGS